VTVGYEDVYTNYEGSTNESYTIAGVILTSPDGAAWTSQDSGAAALLKGVAGGNNVFVAVGDEDVIVTSSDGVNWTNRGAITTDTNSPLPGPDLLAVAFGSNQFVAVGYDVYGGASPILTSADGVSWTSRSSNTSNSLSAVTWGGNQFVAVGDAGEILSSPDGVGWTSRFSETNANLSAVAYGSNMFVAVGYKEVYTYTNSDEGGTNVGYTITTIDEIILTSPNGATWTAHSSTNDFNSIAWGGNEFAATSLNGAISTSPDGINWTNRVPGNGIALLGATFGESTFVVVGDSGSILQSAVLATPALGLPNMVPSGGARLTITGKPGRPYSIEASTDLLHWVNLTNVTLRTPSGTFVDPSVAGYSHRFYRIIPK
jgi:hypothetical protein